MNDLLLNRYLSTPGKNNFELELRYFRIQRKKKHSERIHSKIQRINNLPNFLTQINTK